MAEYNSQDGCYKIVENYRIESIQSEFTNVSEYDQDGCGTEDA